MKTKKFVLKLNGLIKLIFSVLLVSLFVWGIWTMKIEMGKMNPAEKRKLVKEMPTNW